MEPAKIDWENLEWVFSVDDLYEDIHAPKWVDFAAPDVSIDDEAWFCRPDCNHPKTVEDFLNLTPPSKVQRSGSVCENLPLGDKNRRDANLKRRGILQPLPQSNKGKKKNDKFAEDGENQNPNLSSTPSYQYNSMKAAIKSSTEKKKPIDVPTEETPRLKSTLSARNLFGGGRDVLNQITEFCNELKKLATRAKDRENAEKSSVKSSPVAVKEREKERKPLLEVSKDEDEAMEKSNNIVKEKLRRKKKAEFVDDTENIPLFVDVKNLNKSNQRGSLAQIRTNPPSPQCFSARKVPGKATPPLKASRCKPPERGILLEQKAKNETDSTRNEGAAAENINNAGRITPLPAEKEARTLDVFWFLKPCALAN